MLIPSSVWSTVVVASISSSSPRPAGRVAGNSSDVARSGSAETADDLEGSVAGMDARGSREADLRMLDHMEEPLERRCLSRVAFPVSRLSASIASSILVPSGPVSYEPAKRSKLPWTVARPQKVVTSNATDVRSGSTSQCVVVACSIAMVVISSPSVGLRSRLPTAAANRLPPSRSALPSRGPSRSSLPQSEERSGRVGRALRLRRAVVADEARLRHVALP